jgi:hypothetical protein
MGWTDIPDDDMVEVNHNVLTQEHKEHKEEEEEGEEKSTGAIILVSKYKVLWVLRSVRPCFSQKWFDFTPFIVRI